MPNWNTWKREINKKYATEHPDRVREQDRRWKQKNRAKRVAYYREWYARHPDVRTAQNAALYKIKLKPFCEICGAVAQERHHPDYSKPLEVMHLCTNCHREIHAQKRKLSLEGEGR